MSMLTLSCEQLEGYDNVFLLNGYKIPLKPHSFYKYTPLKWIVKSIEDSKMVFVSPMKWQDPMERLYYKTDLSEHGYYLDDVACVCVSSKSTTNEAACWRFYENKEGGKLLRVSYDKERLLSYLSLMAKSYGMRVFIGQAIYLGEDEIYSIAKTGTPLNELFCPREMDTYHYLSLLLLKKRSYEYENEVRIFLVAPKLSFDSDSLYKVACDYLDSHLITRAVIEPFPDPTVFQNVSDDEESKQIKSRLREIAGCEVLQSRLYERRKHITKI